MKRTLILNKNLDLEREIVAARGPRKIKDEHIALWQRCKVWAEEGMKKLAVSVEQDGNLYMELLV